MLAALVAALLSIAALAACGSSDSNSSSSSTGASTEAASKGSGEGAEDHNGKSSTSSSEQSAKKDESGSSANVPTEPLQVSGGGSSQFRVKGGDNSIQDFGEESDETELEEAAGALHDFYVARAEEDWREACGQLSRVVIQQLEQLGARSKSGSKGCTATLAAMTPPLPPSVLRESTIVDAGSLRTEGDRGFLIYRGAEKTVYAINMAHEGDSWKVAALAGVPLS
jgi:hypothetical protein